MATIALSHYPPKAAYLHIPFCRRRCYYCDFAISVIGDRNLDKDSIVATDYTIALCEEIKKTANNKYPLETIFFGGGTPSLLPWENLEEILVTIEENIGIGKSAEIAMEIDPGTFDRQQLQRYKELGINRFSLGVQSFNQELLSICGRSHSVKDIYRAIDLIEEEKIDNFSLDLISGLPYQNIPQFEDSLKEAISINPKHISCYDLVLESVTAFGKKYRSGIKPLPSDEATADMYKLARELLTNAGYEHYEISNYARSGYQSLHNRVYWENKPYYGFGMSATSYTNNKRFSRPRTRKEYYQWVKNGAIVDIPETSKSDRLLETLMLGLRLTEGVDLSKIDKEFGEETTTKIINSLKPYIKKNLAILSSNNSTKIIKLQDPDGLLISNTILTTLFENFSD